MDNKIFNIIKDSLEPLALVTIIETKGSAPRHNGSKMLVDKKGIVAGTVGGGKGEYLSVIEAQNMIERKSFTIMDIARLGDDPKASLMICGGINKLLIQYIDGKLKKLFIQGAEAIALGKEIYLGTDLVSGQSLLKETDDFPKENYFVDALRPRDNLLILGGGYVGYELYNLGIYLGFEVSVFDDREEFVARERFPEAKLLKSGNYEDLIACYPFNDSSYVAIVTRGHLQDGNCLREIIRKPHKYIGLIGSKRKVRLLFEGMIEDGYTKEELDKVYAPIGLDIKAETPEEIAISVFGEIIREKNGKKNKEKL